MEPGLQDSLASQVFIQLTKSPGNQLSYKSGNTEKQLHMELKSNLPIFQATGLMGTLVP